MPSSLDTLTIQLRNPATRQPEVWSANQVLQYYQTAPVGPDGRTAPLQIDATWYMSDGPGRFYDPAQFPIVQELFDGTIRPDPGVYDLYQPSGCVTLEGLNP